MRKVVISLILTACFFIPQVNASSKSALLTGNQVSLRTGPGTNHSSFASLKIGSIYALADENLYPDQRGCSDGWYKIIYSGNTTGYVCSSYISVVTNNENNTAPSNSCETELSNAGFPSSYWSGLCALKTKYPNWKFNAVNTNLDWSTVVENESICGRSLVQTSNSEYIDNSCNSGYGSWHPASQKAVAYYMDPRNWFDEKYIFQFEYLKYDRSIANSYPTGIKAIIGNTSFYKYHLGVNNDFSNIINTAGANTDVSPIFLASRMNQELGSSTSLYNLYSGVYTGDGNQYYGYYNFFNYGVNDSCAVTYGTAYCGLSYAKNNGWNSPLRAIEGASSKMASNYINVGQYTNYFQKYNVVPTNMTSLYIHQYMTNIAAPSSESKSAYNSYNKLGMLNNTFVFYIPVYRNMESSIDNSNNGVNPGGDADASSLPISSIVTSSGFKYQSGYISGIKSNTSVSSIISSINAISGSSVVVKDAKGNKVTSGNIGTGYKVSISNNTTTEELTAVVKGDTSGDGAITVLDLLQIQKQIAKVSSLTGANLKAADTSGDGAITVLDLLQVQKHIAGLAAIN